MNANKRVRSFRSICRPVVALGVVGLVGAWITAAACAGEHPAEHPMKSPPKPGATSKVTLEEVATFIEGYVKDKSRQGLFKVTDKEAKQELSLKLDKVHRERLSQVGPAMFFVCADFKTPDGKKVYDLDFFVQGASKEKLTVLEDKTSIHKENGKARYTWMLNEKTGIWEQKPVETPPGKRAGMKKMEHPEHPQ
ncbi:MAG: hypothetical protein ACYC35_03480 [Pirellulales bacterium]